MFSSYDPAYQGFSLALSGDARTLYIGSPYSVSGIGTINFTNRGIYVYRRFNNKWIQIKEMNYSNDPTYYYHIGYSMSTTTDGSILSVGGPSTFDFFGTPYIGIGSVGVFY
jgi:hypothetical protein